MKKFLLFFALLLPTIIWAQQINVSPETLTDFFYDNEGPSEEKTFVVSATGLIDTIGTTDTLVITASERFEISTQSGEGFETTLRLFADADGTVDTTTIYVRMIAGLPAGSYDDTIVVSSQRGYAQDAHVHCHGTVVMPTLPTPSFSLPSNTYTGEQQVNITCDIENATIHYRHDPGEEWLDYTSPILIDRDMTIWAKATKEGYNDSEEVSAEYAIEYTITVTANSEYGTVNGGGTYHYDDIATLHATPNEGYLFSSWSNDETANPMVVTVTGNATYQAIFEAISYQITVIADPEDGGVVSGSGTYHFPDMPTVTAVANDGFEFVNWTEDGEVVSYEPEYTFFSLTSRVLVAHFNLVDLPTIIGRVTAPEAICAGNSLQLNEPEVSHADTKGWQISPDTTFAVFSPYTDQILDDSYNGWQLRYMASNDAGTTYSENLTVTVYQTINADEVEPIVTKNCGTSNVRMLVYPRSGYQYQWYKDGQAITGATGQYYYPKQGMKNGTYYVEISMVRDENNNLRCPVASPEIEVVVTTSLIQGKAYPNPCPTVETLFIMREKEGEALLHLYSIDGKLVYSQTITQGQNAIGVNLPNGIYVSYIIDGQGETQTERIIIQ